MLFLLLAACTHDVYFTWSFERDGAVVDAAPCNRWESFNAVTDEQSIMAQGSCLSGNATALGVRNGRYQTGLGCTECSPSAFENTLVVAPTDPGEIHVAYVYTVPDEDCANLSDDDYDALWDCGDPDCDADPACLAVAEDCANDDDDDDDGLVDCDDTDCDDDPACPTDVGFVNVPASTFQMGCTEGQSTCREDETVHDVTLTHDYFVGETEVTQGEFEAVMGYNPSEFTGCGADCPVDSVTWHESAAYANAMSDAAGLSPCYSCTGSGSQVVCAVAVNPYDCSGHRLLTEAEWEGAARCGTDLEYAGSDDILDVGWIVTNSGGTPHAVGGLAPNACGLYDMSGNMREWTQDGYGAYGSGAATDPVGADSGSLRTERGGWWEGDEFAAGVALRGNAAPEWVYRGMGFRLGRSMP